MKQDERRKTAVLDPEKTIEAPAFVRAKAKDFVPYSDEESREIRADSPTIDVEKNIDEAEKYIDAIVGKHTVHTDIGKNDTGEHLDTEELMLFEPKDLRFEEMPEIARTETFTVGGGKWEMPDTEDAKTEVFGLSADEKTVEAKAFSDETSKTENDTKTVDVSVLQDEQKEKEDIKTKPNESYQGFEYTDEMQKHDILSRMRSRYFLSKIRLAVAVLFAAALFALENVDAVKALFPNHPAYVIADWVLAFASALLVFDRLGTAIRNTFKFRFDMDTVTLWALVLSMTATAVAVLFETPEHPASLYNFPLSVCVFLNALAVFYMLRRDILSFKILSAHHEKSAFALNEEDGETKFAEICSADFIHGYFAHKEEPAGENRSLRIFIPFCLLISIFVFLGAFLAQNHTVSESLGVAYASFMMCAPFSVFVSHGYPAYLASRRAYSGRSAVLCDKTPEYYRDAAFVAFGDTDAFPAAKAKVRGIKLYADRKIDHAIHYAHLVYEAIGGPLAGVFAKADLHSEKTETVTLREVCGEGVCALIDDKNIVIGTPAYMEEQCFETVYERGDEEYEGNSAKRIFYLACDQIVIAKFYIQYTLDPEFKDMVRYLFAAGVSVSVRTADPCLDNGVFFQNGFDPIRYFVKTDKGVLKSKDKRTLYAKDAGVISLGKTRDLVKAMLLCKKLEKIKRTNLILQTVACVLGVAVMALVLFTGQAPKMLSVYPILYQLFWLLPVYFVAKIYV